jgi:RecJ-like exonuclease
MIRPICKHCHSDVNGINPTIGAHNLCDVAVKRGGTPPYLGYRCPACDGTGMKTSHQNATINVMQGQTQRQFDAMMDALHCSECKHTGTIKDRPMWPRNPFHQNKI